MKPIEDNVDDDLETSATSKPTPTPPESATKGVFFLKKNYFIFFFLFRKIWSIFEIVFQFSIQNWQYSHPTNPNHIYQPTTGQLRSWKKRSNSLREFTTSTESDADSPRSRSGSGLRSWKKRVNALDSASEDDEQQQTASLPSTQLDRPRSESSERECVCSGLMMINDDVSHTCLMVHDDDVQTNNVDNRWMILNRSVRWHRAHRRSLVAVLVNGVDILRISNLW